MPRPLLLIAILPAWLIASDAHATDARRVHWTGSVTGGRSLVVDGPAGSRVALPLPAWATIENLVVSPSRDHALVYAQVHTGETRTVFVVDLVHARVEGRYKPGFGGQFFFTANDNVFQYWGCGTQCAGMQIRSRAGALLMQRVCAGFDHTAEFARDRRVIACFEDSAGLEIIDADSARTLVATKSTPCAIQAQRDNVVIDSAAGHLRYECPNVHGDDLEVTVAWRPAPHITSRSLP